MQNGLASGWLPCGTRLGCHSCPAQLHAHPCPSIHAAEDLSWVGLVVWQAGFVLADLLLRRPPFGSWHGASVLDLGCGTGVLLGL